MQPEAWEGANGNLECHLLLKIWRKVEWEYEWNKCKKVRHNSEKVGAKRNRGAKSQLVKLSTAGKREAGYPEVSRDQ
jgi:hypothetical protein